MTTYCIRVGKKYVNFVGKIRHKDSEKPAISYTLLQAKLYQKQTGGEIIPVEFVTGKAKFVDILMIQN